MEKVNKEVAAPVANKVVEPVLNADPAITEPVADPAANKPLEPTKKNDEPSVLNPFEVSLVDFIQSMPDKVSIREYMKDYSDNEIEIVEREVANYNKLKK